MSSTPSASHPRSPTVKVARKSSKGGGKWKTHGWKKRKRVKDSKSKDLKKDSKSKDSKPKGKKKGKIFVDDKVGRNSSQSTWEAESSVQRKRDEKRLTLCALNRRL